ncbi:MAG: ABC transporter permease [Actinobacteria bacterium]|nr:ABC transporter permease [Actinomycetota bacterium]
MRAIALKELRELRRDRRTLAMLFLLPLLFLVVFGYAASFDVREVPTAAVGPQAEAVGSLLPAAFVVRTVDADGDRPAAEDLLRRGEAVVGVVTPAPADGRPTILIDGTELFAAQAALRSLAELGVEQPVAGEQESVTRQGAQTAAGAAAQVEVLFNPDLRTAVIMIPGLCGIILVFIGTIATALGVVRERQSGTMEQLAVMPFRPHDVFFGKIAPYLLIAAADMAIVVVAGILLFDVPFRGSVATFALGSLLFLFVTVGTGVVISSVSQTQAQAMQLAVLTMVPQFLLSGLFFPLYAMPWAVRWIGYVLPLTWFIKVARGVMARGAPIDALWLPLLVLGAMAAVVFAAATLRFRRDLAPAGDGGARRPAEAAVPAPETEAGSEPGGRS